MRLVHQKDIKSQNVSIYNNKILTCAKQKLINEWRIGISRITIGELNIPVLVI